MGVVVSSDTRGLGDSPDYKYIVAPDNLLISDLANNLLGLLSLAGLQVHPARCSQEDRII